MRDKWRARVLPWDRKPTSARKQTNSKFDGFCISIFKEKSIEHAAAVTACVAFHIIPLLFPKLLQFYVLRFSTYVQLDRSREKWRSIT
jgi:penicillin-binding protein-related factor A (putative recombinase)